MQVFDIAIPLESRIMLQFLMLTHIICIYVTFWCINFCCFGMKAFSWFWWCFCVIHKNHVHNILHHQKVLCEYDSMFVMLFIGWCHVVTFWNQQSHSKCFCSCNSWLMFWNAFLIFFDCFLTCFYFWIYFVIFVCCSCVHITVILVLSKTSWYDKCNYYWHSFLSLTWCFFVIFYVMISVFFSWNSDCFAVVKKFYDNYFQVL